MAEKDIANGPSRQPKPAESKPVDYAYWELPGDSFRVIYSLSLFHEIDFVVNEGYRKIPHGGIEEGGLLFGKVEKDCLRIEAYKPIACEHVLGPSFVLSERDLANLEVQLMAAASDKELANLQPVGWFLAHTRGPLTLTDQEMAHFDRLFPEVFRLTVLVKPERFQPTRFGFLVRDGNRQMQRDATPHAIILPLPGRGSKQTQSLIPSIPAPAPSVSSRRVAEPVGLEKTTEKEPRPPRRRSRPAAADVEAPPPSIWKVPPAEPEQPAELPEIQQERDEEDLRSEAQRAARKQLAKDRARVMAEPVAAEVPLEVPRIKQEAPPEAVLQKPPAPVPPAVAPPSPIPERPVQRASYRQIEEFKFRQSEPLVNAQSLSILAIAALLGCLAGYIGYLQMPAAVIALQVTAQPQAVTVSWPADETRDAIYVSIRVNNGAPLPLSKEEKISGQTEVKGGGDMKVEVLARNWMRDCRGIVYYVRSAKGNAGVLPTDSGRY
jgi:hypothetical protein